MKNIAEIFKAKPANVIPESSEGRPSSASYEHLTEEEANKRIGEVSRILDCIEQGSVPDPEDLRSMLHLYIGRAVRDANFNLTGPLLNRIQQLGEKRS